MAPEVRALATKSEDLSLIHRTYMVDKRTDSLRLSSKLYSMHAHAHKDTHTRTHTDTHKDTQNNF